ncbi:pickpocket protein 28 [Drosophila sulfurigaster albostrigata]|uniref:pickpocket protein 28 n=1 Tax=Drosophila sulfurigaster albostrigata TaxID=89887 RepID=UPI002D219EF1|nr:pickpocket protein 28 [Drosophila sulfurigaster albostrigata]
MASRKKLLEEYWKRFEVKTKEFLSSTSLQGMKYIWNNSLPTWVQFYFGKIFLVSVYVAINLAVNVFNRWQSTPVIIGYSSKMTSIQDIPFPAITVCDMNKAKYSKVINFTVGSLEYAMLQKACFQDMNFTQYKAIKPRSKNDTFPNFIIAVSHKCEDMIVSCMFEQKNVPCTDIFREFFVDEGLCCVFNFLHPYYLYKYSAPYIRDYTSSKGLSDIAVDWNPINGYPKNLPAGYYPRRGVGTGVDNGLQIILNGHTDDYYCSSTNGQGFKVLLYNSIDQPRLKESGLPVMLGHETNFRLMPSSFEAMPNLRSIDRKKRQCIFTDEQELLFYRYYTRRNCEAECDAQYFYRRCDCIPYHLPLVYRNASVCHVRHFDCLIQAELQIVDEQSAACKELCLASCHDVSYFPDPFSIPFHQKGIRVTNEYLKHFSTEYIRKNLAVVNFYHNDNLFRSNMKSSYTGITEYMSLTGGIMSLMVGFSVVFISELFYFLFLRYLLEYIHLWVKNRRNRVHVLRTNPN